MINNYLIIVLIIVMLFILIFKAYDFYLFYKIEKVKEANKKNNESLSRYITFHLKQLPFKDYSFLNEDVIISWLDEYDRINKLYK